MIVSIDGKIIDHIKTLLPQNMVWIV